MQLPLAAGFLGLSENQITLLLSGVALIFLVRWWRLSTLRNRANTGSGKNAPAQESSYVNPLSARELTAEISALLAELEETTRRVAAQMSNRRTALELLLKEADEKIRRLESLTRAAPDNAPQRSQIISPAALPDPAQTLTRLRKQRGAPVPAEDPAYRPIYQMADQGKTSREIAQELGRQPGEIDLILALRAKQRV